MNEFSTFAWFQSGWVGCGGTDDERGPNARRESIGIMIRRKTCHLFGIHVCLG